MSEVERNLAEVKEVDISMYLDSMIVKQRASEKYDSSRIRKVKGSSLVIYINIIKLNK